MVFFAFGQPFSWRDLVLLAGGLFLIYKAATEIFAEVEGEEHETSTVTATHDWQYGQHLRRENVIQEQVTAILKATESRE